MKSRPSSPNTFCFHVLLSTFAPTKSNNDRNQKEVNDYHSHLTNLGEIEAIPYSFLNYRTEMPRAKSTAPKETSDSTVATKEKKSTGKRSADKISESVEEPVAAKEKEKKATDETSKETKSDFEQNIQSMKAEAEEKRLKVLHDYLKENQGKTIVVTKPPPKKEKTTVLKTSAVVNKKVKSPKPKTPKPTAKPVTKAAAAKVPKAATSSSSSSSSSAPKATATSVLPKKLAGLDETQLLAFLHNEINLSPRTTAIFKKEKVDGMYLRGLWQHRNDAGMKDRIADIFQKIVPDDRDYAMLSHVLSTNALRM